MRINNFKLAILGAVVFAFTFLFSGFVNAACDDYDGWYNVGSAYSCCDGNQSCQCQDQEYRDYSTACTSWGQNCTSYETVCTQQGQCCTGYGQVCTQTGQCCTGYDTRCAAWGPQQCIAWESVCSAYTNVCTLVVVYCSNISFYCSAYGCTLYITGENCYCSGAMFLGICIGSIVCTPYTYCAASGCIEYTSYCSGWSSYCGAYTQVCSAYTQVCTHLYLPCAYYETYCTGYQPCCLNYEQACLGYQPCCLQTSQVCTNWQPYCASYGCSYSVTNTRTVKNNCSLVAGQCGYAANNAPSASGLYVNPPSSADYCGISAYPPVRVNWNFSDDDPGDTQSAYEIEVFRISDGSKVVDTGKKLGDTEEYVFSQPGEQLSWGQSYAWNIMVWDNKDAPSAPANGPQINTISHAYPSTSFTFTPTAPSIDQIVIFTNTSQAFGGSSIASYYWTITQGAGIYVDSTDLTSRDPHIKFSTQNNKISLQITDSNGYTCTSSEAAITVRSRLPEWQEVPPIIWLNRIFANISGFFAAKIPSF